VIAPIAGIGRVVSRWVSQLGALTRFLSSISIAAIRLPRAGRKVVWRVFKDQVWFTAVQAIPLVAILSAILSFLVISQAVKELGRLGASELIGTLLVLAIVRELGPLLTALTVAGRSGTAIAAELATNRTMGEIKALEGMGIDPVHYIVVPRFWGALVSVFGLIILFDIVAIASGLVAASTSGMAPTRYFDIVMRSLTYQDIWITVAKGVVFGAVVGLIPSFQGLAAGGASTDVPVAASRAIVGSMLGIFLLSVVFVLFAI
jgi:phospholipid/cholesterol/gamma-HCH transport system permease protein